MYYLNKGKTVTVYMCFPNHVIADTVSISSKLDFIS